MGALAGKRVYLVGDSWVAGAAGRALSAALHAEGAEVHINGVVGRTSRALAHEPSFSRYARGLNPDVILYLIGINDDPASTRLAANYTRLRDVAQTVGADAWVLPNTMFKEPHLTRIARVTQAQVGVFGDHVLDTRGLADEGAFDGSGYHLHRAGAERWAARLLPRLLAAMQAAPVAPLDTVGRLLMGLVPGSR
jgi:lysophospholipase L1-like esterase